MVRIYRFYNQSLPFARAQFRGSCPVFGAGSNVPNPQCSQGVFLLSLICQGSRA